MCDPSVRSSTFAHTGLINSWFVCKKNAKWNSKVISSNLFSMNFGKVFWIYRLTFCSTLGQGRWEEQAEDSGQWLSWLLRSLHLHLLHLHQWKECMWVYIYLASDQMKINPKRQKKAPKRKKINPDIFGSVFLRSAPGLYIF